LLKKSGDKIVSLSLSKAEGARFDRACPEPVEGLSITSKTIASIRPFQQPAQANIDNAMKAGMLGN